MPASSSPALLPQNANAIAHVRYIPGGDSIILQFPLLGVDRQLVRQVDEEFGRILVRIERLRYLAMSTQQSLKQAAKQGSKTMISKSSYQKQLVTSMARIQFKDVHDVVLPATLSVRDALLQAVTLQIHHTGNDENDIILFDIRHNEPVVRSIKIGSQQIFCGIPILPSIDASFCTTKDCQWTWSRECTKEGDGTGAKVIGTELMYTPCAKDIGASLTITCTAPNGHRVSLTALSTVQAGPNRAVFAPRQAMALMALCPTQGFRVMSYNILYAKYTQCRDKSNTRRKDTKTKEPAASSMTSLLYPYAAPGILDPDYRMPLVLLELLEARAHVLCLQEMGEAVFTTYFEPILHAHGFTGLYAGKAGSTREGVAMFIETRQRWNIIESEVHVLKLARDIDNLLIMNPSLQQFLDAFPQVHAAIRSLPTVAQVVALQSKHPPRHHLDHHPNIVLVANTHLFFRKDGDAVRMVQAALITTFLEWKKRELMRMFPGASVGVVIAGDFNALPDTVTMAFLFKGHIHLDDDDRSDWRRIFSDFQWTSHCPEFQHAPWKEQNEVACTRQRHVVQHSLSLANASGLTVPPFTHFVKNHEFTFIGTLDYILIDTVAFRHSDEVSTFPFLTQEEAVGTETSLPTSVFPSDHMSVICDIHYAIPKAYRDRVVTGSGFSHEHKK
jgi:2',5'-phosphodiesterase